MDEKNRLFSFFPFRKATFSTSRKKEFEFYTINVLFHLSASPEKRIWILHNFWGWMKIWGRLKWLKLCSRFSFSLKNRPFLFFLINVPLPSFSTSRKKRIWILYNFWGWMKIWGRKRLKLCSKFSLSLKNRPFLFFLVNVLFHLFPSPEKKEFEFCIIFGNGWRFRKGWND